MQSEGNELPQYDVVETRGDAHAQEFVITCSVATLDTPTTGRGSSKRAAEQEAAKSALEALSGL